jgi:hypothetical protein
MFLEFNELETEDSPYLAGKLSLSGNFYQIGKLVSQMTVIEADPGVLFEMIYWCEARKLKHNRKVYTLLDMLEEIGGLIEALMLIVALMILPISDQSFYLSVARRLYKARVYDTNFF